MALWYYLQGPTTRLEGTSWSMVVPSFFNHRTLSIVPSDDNLPLTQLRTRLRPALINTATTCIALSSPPCKHTFPESSNSKPPYKQTCISHQTGCIKLALPIHISCLYELQNICDSYIGITYGPEGNQYIFSSVCQGLKNGINLHL